MLQKKAVAEWEQAKGLAVGFLVRRANGGGGDADDEGKGGKE